MVYIAMCMVCACVLCVCVCVCVCVVCFDTNFSAAAERKTSKYFELVEAIGSTTAYRCYLYTLQVGSRGIVDQDSFNPIKSILHCTRKDFNRLLLSLSITAMTESFKIWSRRDCCD